MFGKSSNDVVSARSQGVRTNAGEPTPSRGEPNTLVNAAEGSIVFVEYFDGTGAKKTTMLFKLGDEYYGTKDGDEWTKRLQPAVTWMKKALDRAVDARKPVEVPTVDNVDVD